MIPLLIADLKMLLRNRQALFWALVFPLIFVVVFGLFNMGVQPSTITVVDHASDDISIALVSNLDAMELIKVEKESDEAVARQALADGDTSYVLIIPPGLEQGLREGSGGTPAQLILLYDESQGASSQIIIGVIQQFLDKFNMVIAGAPQLLDLQAEGAKSKAATPFDFMLPGFVGLGVMTYAIAGLAVTITQYRQQRILKRIQATPLPVRSFFSAMILSHLLLSLAQVAIILAAGVFLFDGHVYGNLFYVFVLALFANIIFLNLGFVVGSLTKTVEAASGLANVITIPMMFFSGVFFPTDSLPSIMARVVKFLPLTPLLDALRGVILNNEPLWAFPWELILLGAWVVISSALAIKAFKFD